MHKTLVHIYYLIICSITTIVILVESGLMLSSCIDWKFPSLTNRVALAHYASNDKFLAFKEENNTDHYAYNDKFLAFKEEQRVKKYARYSAMSNEELELVRNQEKNDHIVSIQSRAIENITRYAVWLIIGLICFYIHWGFYRRSLR